MDDCNRETWQPNALVPFELRRPARQEGGHSYLAIPFSLGTAQSLELPGEGELGRIVLDTVPRR